MSQRFAILRLVFNGAKEIILDILAWLALSRLACCCLDIKLKAGKAARQANILPAAANRDRLLVFRHIYLGVLVLAVDLNSHYLGRAEGVANVRIGVFVVHNDIDLFLVTNLINNGIDPCAMPTNKGTNRVDPWHGAQNSQLSAATCFAGDPLISTAPVSSSGTS